jgi:hypothetical protein
MSLESSKKVFWLLGLGEESILCQNKSLNVISKNHIRTNVNQNVKHIS